MLPLGTKVTVQGEAFAGSNLGGFQAGIFQGLIADGAIVGPAGAPVLDGPRGIDTKGGWVQVTAAVTPTVTVHGGFGTDNPDDEDFLTVVRRETRHRQHRDLVRLPAQGLGADRLGRRVPPPRDDYLIAGDKDVSHVNVGFTFTF